MSKPKCGVCKRTKEPYEVFITADDIPSYIHFRLQNEQHEHLCEWCRTYEALAHEFKFATMQEMKQAIAAKYFSKFLKNYLEPAEDKTHEWPGTARIEQAIVSQEQTLQEFTELVLSQTKQHPEESED